MQFAFTAARVIREDIEDKRRAVDHLFVVQRRRNIERLGGGQIAVEKDGHVQAVQTLAQLLQLAGADVRRWIDVADLLKNGAGVECAGALDQRDRFIPQCE